MIRPICRDVLLLSRKSTAAGKEDLQTAIDLADTLRANSARCVGMVANMIGVLKNIIAVQTEKGIVVMINPVIVAHSKESYEASEGCLSLNGERMAKRYKNISVEYRDMNMKKQRGMYSDFTAQIIQHEIDHLNGILI